MNGFIGRVVTLVLEVLVPLALAVSFVVWLVPAINGWLNEGSGGQSFIPSVTDGIYYRIGFWVANLFLVMTVAFIIRVLIHSFREMVRLSAND